ncbi:hypothetical protein F5887DRAFT_920329 [Amanita rubescens]|nr:hypothetical protein F5887DRAFT_920329 [Amanita rubescens]
MSDVISEKRQCRPTEKKALLQAEEGLQQSKRKAVDHEEGSSSSNKSKKAKNICQALSGPTVQEKEPDHEEGSSKKHKKSGPSAQEPATIDINSSDDEAPASKVAELVPDDEEPEASEASDLENDDPDDSEAELERLKNEWNAQTGAEATSLNVLEGAVAELFGIFLIKEMRSQPATC